MLLKRINWDHFLLLLFLFLPFYHFLLSDYSSHAKRHSWKKLKSSGSFFVYFFGFIGFRLFSWPLHAATTATTAITTTSTATTTDRSRTMNLCYMNPRRMDFDSMRSMLHTLIASLRYALGSPNWAECWYIFFDNTVFQFWKNDFFCLYSNCLTY